jgi:hypothetical protein
LASECFSKIREAGLLEKGDVAKAQGISLPVNVGLVKDAFCDILMDGRLLGRGVMPDCSKNRDEMLYESGISADKFSEILRGYDEESYRLAGIAKERLERAFRRAIVTAVAEKQPESGLWSALGEAVRNEGIENYEDAPDVEALSIGYHEGLKERLS